MSVGLNVNVTPASTLVISGSIVDWEASSGTTYSLNETGAGTLILTANNLYTGATTISGGTLQLGDGTPGHDGSLAGTMTMTNNGALVYDLNGSQTPTYSISGNGSLTMNGNGTLTLTGNNSFSGATTVSAGSLTMSGANSLPAASSIFASGGTLDLGGHTFTQTGGSIAFSGGVVQHGTLSYGGTYSASAGTVSANLAGAGAAMNINAPGTFLLAGNNSYTGGTTVNGGTLVLNYPGSGGAVAVIPSNQNLTINAATVSCQGSEYYGIYDSTAGTVTVNAGGLLSDDATGTDLQHAGPVRPGPERRDRGRHPNGPLL